MYMKNKFFYFYLALIVINVCVNGLVNFINLVNAGVLLGILSGKEKTGSFSSWKLIVGVTIAFCGVLIGVARLFHLVKI